MASEQSELAGFRIESIWAYLAVAADDDEGVIGVYGPMGWIPAVAADRARLDALRPEVEAIARVTGQRIVLTRFDQRTDVEEITGHSRVTVTPEKGGKTGTNE